MKKKYLLLSLFIIVLYGNARAQLTCTNCRVNGVDYRPNLPPPAPPPTSPTTCILLAAPATSTGTVVWAAAPVPASPPVPAVPGGTITLIGPATFNMLSHGVYKLDCVIESPVGGEYSLTVTGKDATGEKIGGVFGTDVALVLAGGYHNEYGGATIVESRVSLLLDKVHTMRAIPNDLIIKQQANVWCLQNKQFGLDSKIDMRMVSDPRDLVNLSMRFHLYGTEQEVAGIFTNVNQGIIQNYELHHAPAYLTEHRAATPTLRVTTKSVTTNGVITNDDCYFTSGFIRSTATGRDQQDIALVPKLVLEKRGPAELKLQSIRTDHALPARYKGLKIKCVEGRLKFVNPTNLGQGLDFVSGDVATDGLFPSFEFNTDVDYLVAAGCSFDGISMSNSGFSTRGGVFRKKGPQTLSSNVSVFKGSFNMDIEEGTFKNGGDYNNWTDSQIIMNVFPRATFEMWGNHTTLGGLNGGGTVQNNWGTELYNLRPTPDPLVSPVPPAPTLSYLSPGPGSPPAYPGYPGYFYLTVGTNSAEANFSGVIKNNSADFSVNPGRGSEAWGDKFQRGGIALRKVGAGIQMLSGKNTYTGLTLIERGILKLRGQGLLGNGSYGADLIFGSETITTTTTTDFSTFEHNGNLTQEFRGPMRKVGTLPNTAIRYVQSGTGKTIITGNNAANTPKEFPGVVEVTGGFFGGTGNISKAEKVEVMNGGSIGGGGGVANEGGTLTVHNLSFGNNARLVVTNRSTTNGNPSTIEVKDYRVVTTATGPVTTLERGTVTFSGARYLIIDLVGGIEGLGATTIIDATPAATGRPTPIVGVNTTNLTPCFQWKPYGLEMTFNSSSFILSLPATGGIDLLKLCAGTPYQDSFIISRPPNAGFQKFVFNVDSYVPVWASNDPLASATETSLSDGANNSNTIFTINAGTYQEKKVQDVVFTIPFANNEGTCSTNRLRITIHPKPVIEDNTEDQITLATTPLCGGTRYPRAIKVLGVSSVVGGEWKFFKADGTADVNPQGSAAVSNVQAGVVAGDLTPERITTLTASAKVSYSVGGACHSNQLSFNIKRSPDFTLNDITILGGQTMPDFVPRPNGGPGKDRADYFKWVKKSGDAEVGLALPDYTTAWDKTVINGFIAPVPASPSTSLSANYEVTGINGDGSSGLFSGSGCSTIKNFNITVLKNCPTLTLAAVPGTDVNKLCGGVTYTDAVSLTVFPTPSSSIGGEWKIYTTATGTVEAASAAVAGSAGRATITAQANNGTEPLTQQVAYTFPGCSRRLPITIYPSPVITSPNAVTAICSTDNNGLVNSLILSATQPPAASAAWALNPPSAYASVVVNSTPADGTQATLNVLNTEITAAQQATVEYTSNEGCKGIKTITINPAPRISVPASVHLEKLCSGETISITKNTSGGVWQIINETSPIPDFTSATTIATTPNSNGTFTLTAAEVAADVALVQVIRYGVSGGCPSNPLRVTIHPIPEVSTMNDVSVCSNGTSTTITPPTGSGLRGATGYKWRQSGTVHTDAVGLADRDVWSTTAVINFIPTITVASDATARRSMVITPYNSVSGCTGAERGEWKIIVTRGPEISAGTINLAKLCSGGTISVTKNISDGEWQISNNTTTSAFTSATIPPPASTGTGPHTFTVGTVAADVAWVQEIRLQSGTCPSNPLSLTINPKPLAILPAAVNLCGNVPATIPLTTGGGLRAATGYKWRQSGGQNAQVRLYDQDDTPLQVALWAASFPPFTPPLPSTPAVLNRSMVIRPYNSNTSCIGDENPWTITVRIAPVIARNGTINLLALCAGQDYDDAVTVTEIPPSTQGGSWAVYQHGIIPEVAGTISTEWEPSTTSGLANIKAGNAVNTTSEDLVFTSTATTCQSNKLPITINPAPLMGTGTTLAMREFCRGQRVEEWVPPSEGTGSTKPDAFQWEVVPGASSSGIGLEDHSADWTKSSMPVFTIPPPPTGTTAPTTISRNLKVTGRNSFTGCTVSKTMLINVRPTPKIEANSMNLSKLCAGSPPYIDAITVSDGATPSPGSGATPEWYVRSAGTNRVSRIQSYVQNGTSNRGTLTVGNALGETKEDVVYKSSLNCFSNILPITIYPKPVMNAIPAMAYCSGSDVPAFTPVSAGVGHTRPSAYQWELAATAVNTNNGVSISTDNAVNTGVGLHGHVSDWNEPAILGFSAPTITGERVRNLTITGRNSDSECKTVPQVVPLKITSTLTLTTLKSLSPICSGSTTDILLSSSLANTTYTWAVSANTVGAVEGSATVDPAIKQPLAYPTTDIGTSVESVTYNVTGRVGNVTGQAGNCSGQATVVVAVSRSPGGTAPTVEGDGAYCVSAQNNKYETNLKPSASGATAWTYTSTFPPGQASIVREATTLPTVQGTPAALKDNLTLSGNESGFVYYVFRANNGNCYGPASAPVEVSLHPVPVAEVVVASPTVCSNSNTNIQLTSLTTGVKYTWSVATTPSNGVTGYTTYPDYPDPLHERAGAVVSSTNPSYPTAATVSSAISEQLSLVGNSGIQRTVVYSVTPWFWGCPGVTRTAQVQVKPLPVLTMPANRSHCAGVPVPAEILTGSNDGNKFKWTGGLSAGLPDQTVYDTGLPDYTAANTAQPVAVPVSLSVRNASGCESASSFTISVSPKPDIQQPDGALLALCAGTAIEHAATAKIVMKPASATTPYKWSASFLEQRVAGNSNVKIVNNGTAQNFPVLEGNTTQIGDLIRNITATNDSKGTITFTLTPITILTPELNICRGNPVTTTVEVRGINLHAGIVNNSTAGVCSGSPANIKVGEERDGNVYSWTIANNTGNVQGYQPQLSSPATTISNALTLTNTNRGNVTYSISASKTGCAATTLPYTIFVNPVPVFTHFSTAAAAICSGASTNINVSVNLTEPEAGGVVAYKWQVSENAVGAIPGGNTPTVFVQQILTNPSIVNSRVTYTFTPWYTPEVGDGCEGAPAAVEYSVSTLHESAGISDIPEKVCLGDNITLQATPEGLNYQWLKGGEPIPNATGRSYQVPTNTEAASVYSVAVTNSCGSHPSALKGVSVSADAYFAGGNAVTDKANKSAATDEVVNFTYTGGGTEVDYEWNFGDDTHFPDVSTTAHIYYKPETYQPTLKVVKKGQPSCTKTFQVGPLEITGTAISPYMNDLTVSAGLSVFPIPAHDQLTIVNDSDMRYILISDISGKTVWSQTTNGQKALLPIGTFANGIYLLTIMDSKGVKRKKISKN